MSYHPLMTDPASERYAAAPAPGSLRRVQSFLNTRAAGRPPEPDLLARAASANRWLRTLDWATTPRLRATDLPALRALRAALQEDLEARHRGAEPTAPDRELAEILERVRWRVTLQDGQLELAADGTGWQQVAGSVLGDILVAQQHGLWRRLKPCRNPRCSVVFYDSSKNRSRVWHNTSICGNLINLHAARARQRERRG
jgi:predicted RNA-binding Zn ribbon-like protein